jgi:hypothetical protein
MPERALFKVEEEEDPEQLYDLEPETMIPRLAKVPKITDCGSQHGVTYTGFASLSSMTLMARETIDRACRAQRR